MGRHSYALLSHISRIFGIIAVFLGLFLIAGKSCWRGVVVLAAGLALLGWQGKGGQE